MSGEFTTASEDETLALGRRLASELPSRGLVLLSGDLGAGKTALTKGIAEGLGIAADEVSSPTYTLIHEYGDPVRLYHIDLYRLEEARQVSALGVDELLDRDALVVVEWGERFPELWPADRVEIRIEHAGGDARRFRISQPPRGAESAPRPPQ